MLGVLASTVVQEKERTGNQIGKEEVKKTVKNYVILNMENSLESTISLDLKDEFNKTYNARLICGNCLYFHSAAVDHPNIKLRKQFNLQ